jgi:hypothetical protein
VHELVFFAVASLLNLEVHLIFFDRTSTYSETEPDEDDEAEEQKDGGGEPEGAPPTSEDDSLQELSERLARTEPDLPSITTLLRHETAIALTTDWHAAPDPTPDAHPYSSTLTRSHPGSAHGRVDRRSHPNKSRATYSDVLVRHRDGNPDLQDQTDQRQTVTSRAHPRTNSPKSPTGHTEQLPRRQSSSSTPSLPWSSSHARSSAFEAADVGVNHPATTAHHLTLDLIKRIMR